MATQFPLVVLKESGKRSNRVNFCFLGDGFLASQQDKFITAATAQMNYILSQSPFKEYANFCNFYAIKVVSAEEGCSHPKTLGAQCGTQPELHVDTYFKLHFDSAGVHRAIYPDNSQLIFDTITAAMPEYIHSITRNYLPIVIVNTTYPGGGEEGDVAIMTLDSHSNSGVLHEILHSFAGVGDEYAGQRAWNVLDASETAAGVERWSEFYENGIPGTDGIKVGKYPTASGGKTPLPDCLMRHLERPICPVCIQRTVYAFNYFLNLIDQWSPMGAKVDVSTPTKFEVITLKPIPDTIAVIFTLNGELLSATGNSVTIDPANYPTGTHILKAAAFDRTTLVRIPMAEDSVTWTLNITHTTPPPPQPPPPPVNVPVISLGNIGKSNIVVKWGKLENVTGYQGRWRHPGSNTWQAMGGNKFPGQTGTDGYLWKNFQGFSAGQTYELQLRAYLASDWSNTLTVTTLK